MRRVTTWMMAAAMLVVTSMARADLTIEITKGNDSATPIAVVPFENLTGGSLPQDLLVSSRMIWRAAANSSRSSATT